LLVELLVLVVLLMAFAFLKMPNLDPDGHQKHSFANAALAGAVGLGTTLTLLLVLDQPFDRRLTEFFEAASWTEAFGRNIVNVILVDFRAIDTFGEIAVVMIAAIGAAALLKGIARSGKADEAKK